MLIFFTVQHYPEDVELINREIRGFLWMLILWGKAHKARLETTCYADKMKRALGVKIGPKTWSVGSSKSGRSSKKAVMADDGSDDDYMPPKHAQIRPKPKGVVGGSKKTKVIVADDNSDDDFMLPKYAEIRPTPKSVDFERSKKSKIICRC